MRPTPHKALAAGVFAVAAVAALSLPVTPAAAAQSAAPVAAACTPAQVVANGGFESGSFVLDAVLDDRHHRPHRAERPRRHQLRLAGRHRRRTPTRSPRA
ncbi:hypothetical protein ACRAWF_34945 [Streptomyces sp. L7]